MKEIKSTSTEPVRIDKDVLNRARKYVSDTPMTLSGWISSELRSILDQVAPKKQSSNNKTKKP